jgi:Resolvase, N terminal domain
VLIEVDFHLDLFLPWTEQLKVLTYRVRQVLEQHPEAPLARACRPQGFPPFAEGRGHFGCPRGSAESQISCRKWTVCATAAAPPPPSRMQASTTRVHNQRRTTRPVIGFCNRHRHGHLLGYARVSTTDQQPHLQVDALQRAGTSRVFTETASDARSDRPTLEQLLEQLRPGDALAV